LFLKGKTEAQIEEFKKLPPLERLGQAEDIVAVVSFLAGPDAAGKRAGAACQWRLRLTLFTILI